MKSPKGMWANLIWGGIWLGLLFGLLGWKLGFAALIIVAAIRSERAFGTPKAARGLMQPADEALRIS